MSDAPSGGDVELKRRGGEIAQAVKLRRPLSDTGQ
jgi:hypothetical protein